MNDKDSEPVRPPPKMSHYVTLSDVELDAIAAAPREPIIMGTNMRSVEASMRLTNFIIFLKESEKKSGSKGSGS